MPGAAILCARAAQRAGAGLVAVACLDPELKTVVPAAAPEAILVDASRDPIGALRQRNDHARIVGPGLGATARTDALVRGLLREATEIAWVLDADALNVIGGELGLLRDRSGPMVLTPHPGEAARLLGRDVPPEESERIAAAREISTRANAICCLKGHRTVVADGERVYVNETGNPGMATAGAGDVLSGVLGAYLAACFTGIEPSWTPLDAAIAAVHVHGLAGDLAVAETGRRGMVASDLVRFLPSAQARLH
jgi:hydroxyethylthiazole kinase-like uncharacterized protein yjeF